MENKINLINANLSSFYIDSTTSNHNIDFKKNNPKSRFGNVIMSGPP